METNYSAKGNTTTHLVPFQRVNQTAFADLRWGSQRCRRLTLCAVLNLYTLIRRSYAGAVPEARFVGTQSGMAVGASVRRSGCVAEVPVFEPCLGILARNLVYFTLQ